MHVVMNMLRGIPDTCVALAASSVLVFLYCANKRRDSKTHT